MIKLSLWLAFLKQGLYLSFRLPVVRPFEELAVRVINRLAVRVQLAFVAVHDDVQHFLERQPVFERFRAAVHHHVAQQIGDRDKHFLRAGAAVWDGKIESLKRFKDDVREVASGFECGIALEGRDDVQELDVIEAYALEEVARKLE